MFHWIRDQRREALRSKPFPEPWREFLSRNMAHYCVLEPGEREELEKLVLVFLEEKRWEGCGGLELDDEIRVTISAQACLLLLGLPHDYYRDVESILVYPSTVVPPPRAIGIFEQVRGPVDAARPILGQAFVRGPVILVWDAVLRGGRDPKSGHNVVYHEFAHKLDMLDGAADGTPPLRDRKEYREWVEVCSREYLRLRGLAARGKKTFFEAYGATNEAEFFAVATEQFFDTPVRFREQAPDLYRVLQEYYRQDPAARVSRRCRRHLRTEEGAAD